MNTLKRNMQFGCFFRRVRGGVFVIFTYFGLLVTFLLVIFLVVRSLRILYLQKQLTQEKGFFSDTGIDLSTSKSLLDSVREKSREIEKAMKKKSQEYESANSYLKD